MGTALEQRLDQAVEKKEPQTLASQIELMRDQFAKAMPRGMEAQQLVRDALTVIRQTPKLQECNWQTVLGALMTSAQLGLRPGVLGQSYVLPFWDKNSREFKAQFIAGYQGLIELAHRSGRVLSIVARTVYTADEFSLEYNVDKDVMVHRPTLDGEPGDPRLYYARATLTEGGYQMTNPKTHAQMVAFRDRYAKAKNKQQQVVGPWVSEFEQMAHKTMIRELIKLLPKSTELAVAVAVDESVRLHTPGGKLADLADLPSDVQQQPIDGEVIEGTVEPEPASGKKKSANALRDQIFTTDASNILEALRTRGEREGLLDVVVENEHGDDEELRTIAERKREDLGS